MEHRICWIYSEQEPTPRAIEVLKNIKEANGYDDVKFVELKPSDASPRRVLVFGSRAPERAVFDNEYIYTYSIAQIMAKANAATVLTSSLQLYFNGVHTPPEHIKPAGYASGAAHPALFDFDFYKPTAIDIETNGNLGRSHTAEEVEVISVALYQDGCYPVVYHNPATDGSSQPLSESMLDMLKEALPKFTKGIYHNGKFDTRVLNRVLGVELHVWFDTMLAHHVLNHAAGEHGLKILARRYYGAPDWEEGINKHTKGGGHYELIPWGALITYNGWDVYWTYKLWELFAPQIEADEENQKAFEFELALAELLLEVEMNGIPFSFQAAESLRSANIQTMDLMLDQLREGAGDVKFNPNSPVQVKRALSDRFGRVVFSTNEATLAELIENNPEAAVADWCHVLLEYRGLAKQNSTYAEGWGAQARKLDGDTQARVRPTFLVHGTSTGRLSSTKPNAQNMPRDKRVREIVRIEE